MLIDTSAWIEYYRPLPTDKAKRTINEAYKGYINGLLDRNELVYTCPPIIQELLQGASSEKEVRSLNHDLEGMVYLWFDDQKKMAKEAARLFRACRKKGVTVRKAPDCLIAYFAIYFELPLLHNDRDFSNIAQVSNLKEVTL